MTLPTRRSTRHGMTLIELLVVVTVLTILAGLLISRVAGAEREASYAVSTSNLGDTQRSVDAFYLRRGVLPNNMDSLLDMTGGAGSGAIYAGNPSVQANGGVGDPGWLYADALTTLELNCLMRRLPTDDAGNLTFRVFDHDPTATKPLYTTGPTTVNPTYTSIPAREVTRTGPPPTLPDDFEVAFVEESSGVYEKFNLLPYNAAPVAGASQDKYRLVAFGLGPNATIVGDVVAGVAEPPVCMEIWPTAEDYYMRPIVLVKTFRYGSNVPEIVGVVTSSGRTAHEMGQFYDKVGE